MDIPGPSMEELQKVGEKARKEVTWKAGSCTASQSPKIWLKRRTVQLQLKEANSMAVAAWWYRTEESERYAELEEFLELNRTGDALGCICLPVLEILLELENCENWTAGQGG